MSHVASGAVACAHCGAPVPAELMEGAAPDGPRFCCTGCEAVYHALSEAGLERFYEWRELSPNVAQGVARSGEASSVPRELFLEHATRLEDGTLRTELGLEGITCAGCVWLVEQMPRFIEGVLEAELDLGKGRLRLRWDEAQLADPNRVIVWLARFGYDAVPLKGAGQQRHASAERDMLRRVGVSWALAGNVMLLSWAHYAGLGLEQEPILARAAQGLMALLVSVSVVYGGGVILRRARLSMRAAWLSWRAEGRMSPLSMDVPLALGIVIGWGASVWATWRGQGDLWFDSIAMLIAAIITARWFQQRTSQRARQMAEQLLDVMPRLARRIDPQRGVCEEVSVERLLPGDRVEVRAGDVCPADGTIVAGRGALHRGILTGESAPEWLGEGAEIEAGTRNVSGHFEMIVRATGEDSRVGALMHWIGERSEERAALLQRVDRWGGVFVVLTVVASLLAGAVWWQLDAERAVSVMVAILVVSCPCALGMATPLALAMATARGARRGIFIKHDDVLEASSELDVVVFDKTGTLTHGEMRVVEVVGDEEALAQARWVEQHSAHPLARAISAERNTSLSRELRPLEVSEEAGAGMSAQVPQGELLVGRPDWVVERLGEERAARSGESRAILASCERFAARALTPVLVARGGELMGAFGVGDRLREEAAKTCEELAQRGIAVHLLSGDHPALVASVGDSLGLEASHVRGGVSPEEKLEQIMRLKAENLRVMMVGDGVNDAAAMQAADVGVAVRGGAQVSLVAADIFLTRAGLEPVSELLVASVRVRRLVARNLVWLLCYNVFGITLAGLGEVTPLLAAVLMPLSSLGLAAITIWTPIFGGGEAEQKRRDHEHPVRPDTAGVAAGDGGRLGLSVGGEPW